MEAFRFIRLFNFETSLTTSAISWQKKELNKAVTCPFVVGSTSQKKIYSSIHKKVKLQQKNKLNRLILEQKGNCLEYQNNDKWFVNLTQTEFPKNIQYLLSLGDQFNLPYNKNHLPLEQLIVDCEFIIELFPDEDIKNEKRNSIPTSGMSTKMVADQESTIKDSLFDFVKSHIPDADLTLIDDIVLSYVIAFLEDVGSDSQFDVEGFCEMMEAYFPKFGTINHSIVCEWMFDLEEKLRKLEQTETKATSLDISFAEVVPNKTKPRSHNNSESFETPKRVHKLSEMSDGGSTDSSCCDYPDEMDILQEMFPSICTIEVKQCLAIAAGDIERATQILIDRQENGQCLSQNNTLTMQVAKQTIDDAELKNRIIERYSYIDKDALNKEYRPVAPKVEPKKLVRYRDNKIVSLKGERYTEVKKGDDVEDISLKKNKKGQAHTP
ncbi:unnamed protein product [Ceutorhynchus assimilis]|uniref:CUE domain-containing protein 2 n=1 Tax=Ceutorhynchus assimilis TaxID=467358 RepID=A0A9N9MML5_9CUCU|nr:unnamed protein product [Ceutorhynchus assimilis]